MENFERSPLPHLPEKSSTEASIAELKLVLEAIMPEQKDYNDNKGPIDEAISKFTLAA